MTPRSDYFVKISAKTSIFDIEVEKNTDKLKFICPDSNIKTALETRQKDDIVTVISYL